MKKLGTLLIVASSLFVLVACGGSNAKYKEDKSATIEQYELKTEKASVKDDVLEAGFKWKDSDASESSMKKITFGNTGILFFARQGGKRLEQVDESSLNLGYEVYADSFHDISTKFKLNNKEDDVTITATTSEGVGEGKFIVKMK